MEDGLIYNVKIESFFCVIQEQDDELLYIVSGANFVEDIYVYVKAKQKHKEIKPAKYDLKEIMSSKQTPDL